MNMLFVLLFVIFPPSTPTPQAIVAPDVFTSSEACNAAYQKAAEAFQAKDPNFNFDAACIPLPSPDATPETPGTKGDL